MNHLDFILDTKAVTEDGQIEGLAAGYHFSEIAR